MIIRKSKQEDFKQILSIYNQAIPTHQITADLEFVTEENRQQWFDFHLQSEKYPLWSVEEYSGVVGWFSFSPFYERSGFVHTAEISIYFDQSAKGKGYGSQVVQYMQNVMLDYEINTLMAYIFELNRVSIDLMKKHHFECWGRFPNIANMGRSIDGSEKWRTLVAMAFQKGVISD
ncbi:GNAT family N-acetyltransferase [Vespertiliibacter pulmonis]|uniref:Phosphinothricin acetyltransferase n=1 Tax=Vespertiliibacter pulmonis TaxID=1443036 RepID=A0A3N4W0F6_9PAST|nr:GNAT family N-acetyltransferase [Vespertiliibacter pulmonis]QLB21396.1 GNAT family N-acetyltransferase [Vespertiliibacter pulmonis]RPE85809.1 phosphinothricin acetyltransferase [Vespertiliibacter pulmonis]